jgi:hypothetical protein
MSTLGKGCRGPEYLALFIESVLFMLLGEISHGNCEH